MGTKMAAPFANIFMAKVETKILNQGDLTRRSSGNDSLTTSSPSGTPNTIKLSSLQTSWTLLFTKTKDLKLSRCKMYTPTLSPLKHFTTPIFQPAIHQKKEDSSKERL